MASVPFAFEMLSRYFESKQYKNPGQHASGTNATYGHLRLFKYIYIYIIKLALSSKLIENPLVFKSLKSE